MADQPTENPPPEWEAIADARALLDHVESHPGMELADKVALWRDAKEAANLLYRVCKTLEPDLLRAGAGTRGWHNDGRPVQIKRRFEIVVDDAEAFEEWWDANFEDGRTVDPFERTVKLRKAATARIREAVTEDGERPDGVTAGYGGGYLSIGR